MHPIHNNPFNNMRFNLKGNELTNITPFNLIIKPSGARCNLACDYCFFLKKKGFILNSDFSMSLETLKVFISQYLESQPEGEVIFTWQGGEPTLMGIPFYERALEFQEIFKRPSQVIVNTFQTNGIY